MVFEPHSHIHLVGIKGIAMAAFALWAKEREISVSGSDTAETFPSDELLEQAGIQVFEGFKREHVSASTQAVVYTGAHGGIGNVEVKEAIARGIPVFAHGKALGNIMQDTQQISVAGSHGKTTTSSMIATILTHANLDPSYAIGSGFVRGLGMPGHAGKGKYFVAEADEYVTDPTCDKTPRFLWQRPNYLVVTNIDFDHPDVYASLQDVQNAFKKLQNQMPSNSMTIVSADDPNSNMLCEDAKGTKIVTYGIHHAAMFSASHIQYHEGKTTFDVSENNVHTCSFEIAVPGEHNISNALASIALSRSLGISWEVIRDGLKIFAGAKRRFEKIRDINRVTYYDDYAHHPVEIQATLKSVRLWYPNRRIIAVFQPHTYTRTKMLLDDFAISFSDADILCLCDIYASARETDTFGISGNTLFEKILRTHSCAYFAPKKDDVVHVLIEKVQEGDIVVFMGAGDIYSWEKDILSKLSV